MRGGGQNLLGESRASPRLALALLSPDKFCVVIRRSWECVHNSDTERHGLGVDSQVRIDCGCNVLWADWAIDDMFATLAGASDCLSHLHSSSAEKHA